MKIANAPVRAYSPARSQNSTPPAETSPATPQDSFGGKIGKKALQTGIAWGNATGTVVGGAGALTTATAGLYVGVLGGAVVGAALGGGIGPVLGSISGKGALGFLGTSFKTMGFMAKTGVVIGGLAGGVGAASVGNTIGGTAGKIVGFVPGAIVGAASGIGQAAEDVATGNQSGSESAAGKPSAGGSHKVDLNKMNGPTKAVAGFVSGLGMLSGASGGFIAGASIVSAGNLVSGLLARNVSLATMTAGTLTGGIAGAAIMGVVGGVGGWKMVKWGQKGAEWVMDKVGSHNQAPQKETKSA